MLGVFLVGFFLQRVRGTPVFSATLVGAGGWWSPCSRSPTIGFLWYNVIGCAAVILLSIGLEFTLV